MSQKRKIAVVGAGLAGASAALGFANAGFAVTLYSDKPREVLRNGVAATGTAIYFGQPSQDADAQIIENLYGDDSFADGFSVRAYNEDKSPLLSFDTDYHYYRAQAVDVRLRADDRIGRFIGKGGEFRVEAVTPDSLDAIAAAHDLTLVATGKQSLADLFPVDEGRTVYKAPQRHLLTVNVRGLDYDKTTFDYRSQVGWKHNLFTIHGAEGEVFTGPLLHKDGVRGWILLGFAKPGGDWQKRFAEATDSASALSIFKKLFHDYFPEDAAEIDKLQVIESDPYTWLKGAVTPTVRKAVGYTRNGHVVAALGDTAIAVDPLAGQGAQNVSIQVAALVRAATERQGPFDAAWITDQFDAHWERHGYGATEVTRLFLGDPKYAEHGGLLFPSATVNQGKGGAALFRLLSEPALLASLQTRGALTKYIEAETGETVESLLSRFVPAQSFPAREAL
ncbi:oxygenase [Cupriavidus sp. USMAA2-4]|uniref:styrene monooxygenase/indole monooxygenase family protein n=1 Tax=unclassified Cupriavidus TaxID=2640874 RepID=UPI0008A66C1F|nr:MULTISPECIES: styrene monooxygenase/indole monooxygenase family protein [unclassified Cupriavidus]AOY90727.1 oxygenase [Cupriavidus sp. USMAA2-4]AOY99646.1 oxygenase [Cupriavidus sp. USMAHM13]